MILPPAALTVLAMAAVGLVLFHRLARLLASEELPSARDFLLLAPLPGLALVGLLLTLLAALHLLYGWLVLLLGACILWLLRRDGRAVLACVRAAGQEILAAARGGNLFPVLATIAFIAVAGMGLSLALVPGRIVDIWFFHLPLARSIAGHHGFVFPQIDHMFYGSQPLLFELMFATVMLAVDHFAAAGAVNLAVYLAFLLLLLSFAPRARGFSFLLLCIPLVWLGPFFAQAAQPMIDVPRACFSAAAFLFAYRYLCDFRRLDLALCGLLAGAAVAGKYTELLTPLLIGLTLLPWFIRRPSLRPHLGPALFLFVAISCFWYLKNLLLYGNPVYPLLFGHPGLSDAWMRDFMAEITHSPLPADSAFSHDLLTLRGWHDFAAAWLLKFRGLIPVTLLALVGLALPLPRRWVLPFWSGLLFVVWYVLMFNARRWAAPATLILIAAAFLVTGHLLARGLAGWERHTSFRLRAAGQALASAFALFLFLAAGVLWLGGQGELMMPRWRAAEWRDATTLVAALSPCDNGAPA